MLSFTRIWALLGLLALGGCQDTAVPRDIAPPAGLETLDSSVRAQYQQRQEALHQVLDQSGSTAAERAAAFGALGQWFHVYSFYDGAREAYGAARSLAPDQAGWHYYLAQVERTLGHGDKAAELLQQVLELEPENLAARVWLAEIAWQAGRIADAEAGFVTALERNPRCVRALEGRARIARQQGRTAQAIELYERAIEIQPGATSLRYALGLAYRRQGDRQKAAEQLALAPEENRHQVASALLDPRMQELNSLRRGTLYYQSLGRQAFEAGQLEVAAGHFQRALQAEPDNLEALLNLGLTLQRSGDSTAAESAIAEAVARDPKFVRGRVAWGVLLLRRQELDGAQEQFQTAVDLDPRHGMAQFNLAQILRARGLLERALPHYGHSVALNPRLAAAGHGQALTLLWLGRTAEASSALEQHLRRLPGDPDLTLLLARLLAAAPDDQVRNGMRAERLTRTLESLGTSLDYAESLAMALAESGRFEAAEAWQQAALAAASAVAQSAILPRLERRLELYRHHQPCRQPWERGEAISKLPVIPPASDDDPS